MNADPLDVTIQDRTKLDAYQDIRYVMASIHKVFYLGLESILGHLKSNKNLEADLDSWLGYVGTWTEILSGHHHHEEEYLFPVLKKHGIDIDSELAQHEKLHADLEKVEAAVKLAKADKRKYSSANLQALLLQLQPNLVEHLREEVMHLTREKLEPKISEEDLRNAVVIWENKAKRSGNPITVFPFLMTHTPEVNKYWTALPQFVYKIVVPGFMLVHRGWWKYAPEPCNIR